jgi:hypothetical protein
MKLLTVNELERMLLTLVVHKQLNVQTIARYSSRFTAAWNNPAFQRNLKRWQSESWNCKTEPCAPKGAEGMR